MATLRVWGKRRYKKENGGQNHPPEREGGTGAEVHQRVHSGSKAECLLEKPGLEKNRRIKTTTLAVTVLVCGKSGGVKYEPFSEQMAKKHSYEQSKRWRSQNGYLSSASV